HDSLNNRVVRLSDNENITDVQRAKLNLLKTRIHDIENLDPLFTEPKSDITYTDANKSILQRAISLITQTRVKEGMPLLLDYIESVDENADSAVYARIYMAEALRILKEYRKSASILYEIIKDGNINMSNRAFAYNRIAALYNEGGNWLSDGHPTYDSIIKYSDLCIEIATQNDLIAHLATSQNELAYIYYRKLGELDLALEYAQKAVDNFIAANMVPQAMNASKNLGDIYVKKKKYNEAEKIFLHALEIGDFEKYKDLYVRIYLSMSYLAILTEDYRAAAEYESLARKMQRGLYFERIETEMYDMAAKYNLQQKEMKIIEEQQKNKIYQQQKKYLIIIIIISFALVIILFFLFRFKAQSYKNLLQKNLELASCDRKILSEGEFIPEPANMDGQKEQDDMNGQSKDYELIRKFNAYFTQEKPYLLTHINIEEVSAQLETNRTYLSKAINAVFNKSFNTLVNEFRIRTARQLLTEDKYNHMSIEAIGEMVGYNSRIAFYKNFKKITGLTPSYFRESGSSGKK
ncbi:MAG: helix-turn-helix domain-containing protein, partial [Bacteroidota bacterium]|nr:helix-turn-helix domain-containing protein [Bacteroidota bacterium]